MLYKAIVLDNSEYFSRGTIKVRVAGIYQGTIAWDLSEDYPDSVENNSEIGKDFDAILFSPLGGGRNYGALFLPQPNERGIVAFLRDNYKKPVWMGSIFEPVRNEANYDIEYVNIPSDNPEQEGIDSDGSISEEQNMDAEDNAEALGKNIVIRTKNTTADSAENLNWEEQNTTNIISVSNKNIKVRHFSDGDGWNENTPEKWQDISIERDEDNEDKETISLTVQNDTDSKIGSLKLTEDGLVYEVDDNGDVNTFNITNKDDNLGLYYKDKHDNEFFADDTGWTLTMSDGSILEMKNNGDITIEGKSGNLVLKGSTDVVLNSEGDTAVRYSKLKNIIGEVENHVHVAQGPAGPTTGPMKGPAGAPPLSQIITADKNGMESPTVKVD